MFYVKGGILRGSSIILRFLDRSTRKVAACIEGKKPADVNSVYRRKNWYEIFGERWRIDWVVARNTDVENKGEASRWRDNAYIPDLYTLSLVRKRQVFVWRWNPKCITASLWFKKRFINLIACLGCERTLRG